MTAQPAVGSPEKAMSAVFEKGNLMTALSGHEWRPGLNLAAAYLSVGETISLNITLIKDVGYVFLASGATEQTDVDLYVRDSQGNLLAEDQQDDGTPVVEFKAPIDGTFQIQLHLAAGESPESYVALSLLSQGGRQVAEQGYRKVSSGFFKAAKEITAPETGVRWHKQAGEWCVFGYSLQGDDGTSLRGLRPSTGQKIFAAAGPETLKISLYLATEAGRIVAGINQPNAFPLLRYSCPPKAVLDLRIETEGYKPPSLVLVGVFHH